ncbi:serine/threonine protein kinase [Suicoccus acidiformans]|uniref:non-specific serine/threonine protein kinase n=1 Tax=Suicoccus acidiformans TaxID=2036206 RepID=A0A347WKI6_9LACT|nr:Stk1 family PASTA domain-containing Ser/Thr kinase [Suicoccus acidiformans]AXY25593.1 serine/threonine protein kinase [Suicoccus acidiformans]
MVEVGEKLSGRYVINQPIGQGGMANVYLAHDLILNRDVAVKVLRYDFQNDQDAIRRFQREAMSASQLLHHNIVEVYDVDEEQNEQYIVMEYVNGDDLKTFIRENAPISLELAVNIMSQILSAIDVAHRHGIIHRDIKPQNILMTENNQVKITDFGIAIALTDTSITQTNTLLGSVHYLSPEQARGANATTKSDIYALGVVLYELITGSVPFDGESAVSVALKHFQEAFPRIRTQLDYVPQSLENVVLKATAKDPNDRYDNVQQMLNDLSTSLSANRMNEQAFEPSDMDQTIALTPLHPEDTEAVKDTTREQPLQAPEPLDEEAYQTFDVVEDINRPQKSRRWIRIGILMVVGLLIGLLGFYTYNTFGRQVTVPDVSGMTREEAEQTLSSEDIAIANIIYQWHESIPTGNVVDTAPEQGSRIERNSTVDLLVSNGPEQVEIGNYIGQDYESIRRLLTDAGFIVERRGLATNSPEQVGVILDQSIAPGTAVVPGKTSITLTVGSSADTITMQDFYNLDSRVARNFAEEYGLYVEESYEYSEFIPENQIVGQRPASGTPLEQGETIEIIISLGPETPQIRTSEVDVFLEYVPTYADNDTDQENPQPNTIQIFIGDKNRDINQVAEEFEITESTTRTLTLNIPENGSGQYRVLRDGEVIAESNEVGAYE